MSQLKVGLIVDAGSKDLAIKRWVLARGNAGVGCHGRVLHLPGVIYLLIRLSARLIQLTSVGGFLQ